MEKMYSTYYFLPNNRTFPYLQVVGEMIDGTTNRSPGDFSFDPFDLYFGRNEKTQKDMVIKELKNGRLAMIAFSGIVTQAVLTGKDFPFM